MGIWAQAKNMAEQTPPERNRYVDFLRAISILVVVVGHWLIATAWYVDGELTPGHLLKSEPRTQWLTWLFQVMPIFFIVGGYSNAVSLESARRKSIDYAGWLVTRLNRLIAPLLVLLVAWAGMAFAMHLLEVRPAVIKFTSQAALIPTWFLAIYTAIVIIAPLTYRFWRRFGFLSLWFFIAGAVVTDVLFFAADIRWPSLFNYFWVWLCVHQLGFVWRDNRQGGAARLLGLSALGFVVLCLLIFNGPYPMAMVGSPDEGLSNTLPPKITLIALGVFQFGLLLAVERPMRKLLSGLRLWSATVLINSMIMTVYLWHITVMVLLGSAMYLAGGIGLGLEPGTTQWWQTRPLWIGVLIVLLFPVALLMSPLERVSRPRGAAVPSPVRQIAGALMMCLGISLLAMWGYGGSPVPRLDAAAFVMVIVGAGMSGVLSSFKRA